MLGYLISKRIEVNFKGLSPFFDFVSPKKTIYETDQLLEL